MPYVIVTDVDATAIPPGNFPSLPCISVLMRFLEGLSHAIRSLATVNILIEDHGRVTLELYGCDGITLRRPLFINKATGAKR